MAVVFRRDTRYVMGELIWTWGGGGGGGGGGGLKEFYFFLYIYINKSAQEAATWTEITKVTYVYNP